MNNTRELILRLRHDSPTREMSMEAADMLEEFSRAQRRLPHADTVRISPVGAPIEHRVGFLHLPLDEEQLP